ncbi:MAG: RNA-binding protein [Legionellales bacterium]|nr:RNA-binding protein [Legionellales bacterium]|tara:strand:- start:19 stop:270 length:252 start_codon:yes stop_codon:yes gene_type:complete
MNKVYVGNIPYNFSQDDLRSAFESCGAITDVHIPMERQTGRPRGFAFVTFESNEAAQAALKLNGQEIGGRAVKVDLCKEREQR